MPFPILPSNSASGYFLTNSLRFRSSASAYLNRTFTTPTNNKKWTYSCWIKRGRLSTATLSFFGQQTNSSNRADLYFDANDNLNFYNIVSGTAAPNPQWITTQVFRDPSAWYHIVIVWDSDNATAGDRTIIYVNGTRITAYSQAGTVSLGQSSQINSANGHSIGRFENVPAYFDGYMDEINFIDGQALTPSSFGQTSSTTGVWQPKKYGGTYGNNGFYLPFTNNSTTTTLGNDFSGNGNNWTTNNFSLTTGSTYDSMTDVPTLTSATVANYCTFNPVIAGTTNLINGNLTRNGSVRTNVGTMLLTSGKYYFETTIQDSNGNGGVGVKQSTAYPLESYDTSKCATYFANGEYKIEGASQTSGFSSYTNGDVIGIAVDTTQSPAKIWFAKNNTWQGTGNPTTAGYSLTSGLEYYFMVLHGSGSSSTTASSNFGQQPFAYTPPTGFLRLNTFNLPTPTIGATASTQANDYFDVNIWTGNGSTQTITNSGSMQPDLVWYKSRSNSGYDHYLEDSVRGTNKWLGSSSTSQELTVANSLTSFNSNGFTLGSDAGGNQNTLTYVGWQWRASGSTVSNTAGTITSTVSANTTAGFSIVTYTGTGANATVGHGLGVAPRMIFVKDRSQGGTYRDWAVYNTDIGAGNALYLNGTSGSFSKPSYWNSTATTSTVFTLGNDITVNQSGDNFVAYCFAPIAGYSAFGSYVGNGVADGPFIYTGFRPRYFILKNITSAQSWSVQDTSRSPYNVGSAVLLPNSSSAELTGTDFVDILSNGFKIRHSSSGNNNNSGDTYIYMAFAENPFKYSLAR